MKIIDLNKFLQDSSKIPVIDVRSPEEFEKGHIPNAINIPIFDNAERSVVGTRYKQNGKEAAVFSAFDIVAPKMKKLVLNAKQVAKNNKLLLHCWRGGLRSKNMAWLFSSIDIDCYVLDGGYKAYRKMIREELGEKIEIIILGGMTGSGKTDILHELQEKGEQMIDLEALSNHKGSVFGALGQNEQPTNEQFENNIHEKWNKLDKSNRIWIEDESYKIGTNCIPETLYYQMRNTNVLKINIPKDIRVKRLVKEYALFDKKFIENSIRKIDRRLGGQNTEQAINALHNSNYKEVADILLYYYDKAYLHGLSKRDENLIEDILIENDNPDYTANVLIDKANKMEEQR